MELAAGNLPENIGPNDAAVISGGGGGGGESGREPGAKTRQETVRPDNVTTVATVTARGRDDA